MIEVDHVTKRYGAFTAVDDVSFTVQPGEIVGFLGPNGAGKSTLLKMMCTWLPVTKGSIRIAGFDVTKQPHGVRASLGYLTEHNALYDSMRVDRFLRFMGKMRGLSGRHLDERLAWVSRQCILGDVLGKRVSECSKGYRQRIGVAAALVHDPKVILLDEPTHGLDPLQVVAFRDFLRSLRDGRTILFSSHNLAEVASISERLLIINRGKLLADETVDGISERAASAGRTLEDVVLDIVRKSGGSAGYGAIASDAAEPATTGAVR
ncbi:MAG: ABC transporter ATP-binding protein [Planctomycetes bacterium]|nr:ABC transporter ATP-binding protein [Planctomycetota bacterium]